MINIVVALRIWGKFWAGHIITIRCDNMAVVNVANSGKTRDTYMAQCARNIWWLCAIYDITHRVVHIKGVKNEVADALSRVFSRNPGDHKLIERLKNTKVWDTVDLTLGI